MMKQHVTGKLVLIVLFALLFCTFNTDSVYAKSGQTYYVSESRGDDNNDGLSAEHPFKTIERVSELKLAAGDSVLFRRDDVWYGTLTLDMSNGSKENPIKLSAYGEGKTPSLRYYTGYVVEGCAENVMVLMNPNGVEITDLDIGYANAGIRLEYTKTGNQYVKIDNCHFHDIYGTTQATHLPQKVLPFSSSIYTITSEELDATNYQEKGEYPLTEMYITNCTAYDAGSLTGYLGAVSDVVMRNCIAEKNGYYGCVMATSNALVENCVFDNNGTRPMPVGSCGIMLSGTNITIRNSIISNQQRQGEDPDGCGIDLEWKCKKVTIENVLFEGNAGVGVMFFTSGQGGGLGENKGTNYDSVIRNCKFVNNNTNIGNIGGFEIYSVNAGADNCVVENNEFVIDYNTECETVQFELCDGENNITFNNNVQVDSIDKNYNPLSLSEQSGVAQRIQGAPSYLWILLGVAVGVLVLVIIMQFKSIKKRREGETTYEN